jgi:hypothetical protein
LDVITLAVLQLAPLEDNHLLGYFDETVCLTIHVVESTGQCGLQSVTTGAVEAASSFNEATEFCYVLSQSIDLVPGVEYQLVIPDSVGDGMCWGCGDGSASRYAPVDDSDVLITSINGVLVIRQRACELHRIPNDSARAVIMSCFPVSNFRLAPMQDPSVTVDCREEFRLLFFYQTFTFVRKVYI